MLFFFHIPKTAGQSFRKAALEYFGEEKCFLLYGEDSKTTTKSINNIYYKQKVTTQQQKYFLIDKLIQKENIQFYSSHASSHFLPSFDIKNAIVFLRDPIDRIVSHYNYAIHKGHFKGTFEVFIEDPMYQNMQSSLLSDIDINKIGFIGLTEEYTLSLKLFNKTFHLKFKEYKKNKMPFFRKRTKKEKLNPLILEKIKSLNKEDIELYEKAIVIFNERLSKLI